MRQSQAGSALIIGAMALLAVGLAMVAWLRLLGPQLTLARSGQAGRQAERIHTALELAAIRHVGLPVQGEASWQSLGLSPQDVIDPWGHVFSYAGPCRVISRGDGKEGLSWQFSGDHCQDGGAGR